jgi:Major Vault Protein repeat domain
VLEHSNPIPFVVAAKDEALKLEVLRDYGNHKAGEVYHVYGPLTYIPRVEEKFISKVEKTVIKKNQALKLKAIKTFIDRSNTKRVIGDIWLHTEVGAYIPNPEEEVVKLIQGIVLTDKRGVILEATRNFTDEFNEERKAGQRWLVTNKHT